MTAKMASRWLRVSETVLLVMAFLLPLAFYLKTYDSATIKTTLFEAGTVVLAFAWLFKGLERGRWDLPQTVRPLAAPAAALLAWTALRFALAPYKIAALPGFLRQVLYLVTFLIVLLEFGGTKPARRLLGWLGAAAWLAGLYGLAQRVGCDPFLWKGAFGERVFAAFANPDFFGLFLALCVPIALTQWVDPERDWFLRWADLALLLLLGANILWTGSGEALAALAVMGLVSALLFPLFLPSKTALKAAGLSLLLVLATFGAAARLKAPAFGLEAKRQIWAGTAAMLQERPWTGQGPGSFYVHFPRFRPAELIRLEGSRALQTEHPGSLPLETAAELGMIGLGLWAWLFGALAAASWRAARLFFQQGALAESCLLAGLSSAVLGFLIAADFSSGAAQLMPGWILWPLAGTLGGLTALSRRGASVHVFPLAVSETARRTAYAPAFLAFFGLLLFPLRWFQSDVEHNLAVYHSQRRQWPEALAHYDRVRPGADAYVLAQYFKANAYLNSDRPEEALKAYARVESLAPDYLRLHYQKALAYAALDDWKNAMAGHEREARLDPLFADNYAAWARTAKAAGDFKAAERAAFAAIGLDPKDPARRLALAEVYMKEKRVAAARRLQRQAAQLKKESTGGRKAPEL